MQREITVKEFENVVSKVDDIEPMIIKGDNKKDLIVISLEQYEKEIFLFVPALAIPLHTISGQPCYKYEEVHFQLKIHSHFIKHVAYQ